MLSPCDLVSPAYNLFAQLDCRRPFPCWNACKGAGQVPCRGATARARTFLNLCPPLFAGAPVIIITDLSQRGTDLRTHSDTTNTRLAPSSAFFFSSYSSCRVSTCQRWKIEVLVLSMFCGRKLSYRLSLEALKVTLNLQLCLALTMHNSILGVDQNTTNSNHKLVQALLLNTMFMPAVDSPPDWLATMCFKIGQSVLKQKQCLGACFLKEKYVPECIENRLIDGPLKLKKSTKS